tara:strand:- start:23 stop:3784 length:3762 start_codon:yes stop_codon:yes gene_type:complete
MTGSDVELLMRIPVKEATAFAAASKTHPLATSGLELEPLFEVPGPISVNEMGLAAGGKGTRQEWYVARQKETRGANPWDVAHRAMKKLRDTRGLAATSMPNAVEPNIRQQWIGEEGDGQNSLSAAADSCQFEDQQTDLPFQPGQFAWHLGDSFSQLADAREFSKANAGSRTIRIAHLDTGYDKSHSVLSDTKIIHQLERNFVDKDRPNDARDLGVDGVLKSPGHGTGTLSILAGGAFKFHQSGYSFEGRLGGAPDAEIVPVRVGNSVVQLTTKDIAQGINYAADLCGNDNTQIDVISMSMGGVASAVWADAVNKAYEAGIIIVAAAGNNYSAGFFGFPTHKIVYPARFRRVIAACGVMSDRTPYYGLRRGTMQGNWGPEGAMATALAAFTPNIAWAKWGCEQVIRMNGAGTSSATPQIAATAALYLQLHSDLLFDSTLYSEPWMRVEAVRQAMFRSADITADGGSHEKLGNGLLRANTALSLQPVESEMLHKARSDSAGFPFLNVLSRRGITVSQEDEMLQLEATQLAQRWHSQEKPNPLDELVKDPDRHAGDVPQQEVEQYLDAVTRHPDASEQLKARAREVLDRVAVQRGRMTKSQRGKVNDEVSEGGLAGGGAADVETMRRASSTLPTPPFRKLRAYAVDPNLSSRLDTVNISEVTLQLPWEELKPGPSGEYVEVVDIDPPNRLFYEPVNLDEPALLAQDGLAPSEAVPQFHQQMTYAICSLTIKNFERALGRKALWRPGPDPNGNNPFDDSNYVQKLRIYPHALCEANAYYSPAKVALLFGYFDSIKVNDGKMLPGGRVFTCLSHDIITHETTHALLDGMHRRFLLPSNPDVHAFHEGFADCVAMLQHFSFPELVSHQIRETRGEIDAQQNMLVQLARQFGLATSLRSPLRDAIGEIKDGEWKLKKPDPTEYETITESHARGRILVAAIFNAFLSIYRRRTSDLLRLATGGSGILPQGSIHPDLVNRLTAEASRSAEHALTMCIRALDYCPPTDITFGEYLRAIITADCDVVKNDRFDYRVSFIEAFRRRGIFPPGVRSLSVSSLKWRSVDEQDRRPSKRLVEFIANLREFTPKALYAESRKQIFFHERNLRIHIHEEFKRQFQSNDEDAKNDAAFLGLNPKKTFQVHTARIAFRPHPDGGISPQLLIGLLQATQKPIDPKDPAGDRMDFEGGCSLVADLYSGKLLYCIHKKHFDAEGDDGKLSRLTSQRTFAMREFDSLRATYRGQRSLDSKNNETGNEPFALIHREN